MFVKFDNVTAQETCTISTCSPDGNRIVISVSNDGAALLVRIDPVSTYTSD